MKHHHQAQRIDVHVSRRKPGKGGYTFIELTVVIFLIGLLLFLAVPRFQQSILTDDLKATVRRMVGTARSLRSEAIREQKDYLLRLDIGGNRYWIEATGLAQMTDEARFEAYEEGIQLPEGIRILDVWKKETGTIAEGRVDIRFTTKGYVERSAIHVGDDAGRQFTLIFNPFLGTVKIYDRYIEVDSS